MAVLESFDWTSDLASFSESVPAGNITIRLTPIPKSQAEIEEKETRRKVLLQTIEPVVELKSDYLDCSSYYYSRETNKIYEIENITVTLHTPSSTDDTYLRDLNDLPST